tara:strand:+ start:50 stop:454 length:405 start_codon:yes stop_codon:yes gene_type:complete
MSTNFSRKRRPFMQPEEIDEMPAADDDLHPDTVLDEANNAAQLAAIDAATHNHLHSENARLGSARGMWRSANAVPLRADGSVVADDFTFKTLSQLTKLEKSSRSLTRIPKKVKVSRLNSPSVMVTTRTQSKPSI